MLPLWKSNNVWRKWLAFGNVYEVIFDIFIHNMLKFVDCNWGLFLFSRPCMEDQVQWNRANDHFGTNAVHRTVTNAMCGRNYYANLSVRLMLQQAGWFFHVLDLAMNGQTLQTHKLMRTACACKIKINVSLLHIWTFSKSIGFRP